VTPAQKDKALRDLGAAVLHILVENREWTADVLDEIASLAYAAELAQSDADGYFQHNLD